METTTIIVNLLRLVRPVLISEIVDMYEDGESLENVVDEAISRLYTDDTFSGYSDGELAAAITEIITEE